MNQECSLIMEFYLQFSWLNTMTGSTLLLMAPGYVDWSLLFTVLNTSGTVLLTHDKRPSFLSVKQSIPFSAIKTRNKNLKLFSITKTEICPSHFWWKILSYIELFLWFFIHLSFSTKFISKIWQWIYQTAKISNDKLILTFSSLRPLNCQIKLFIFLNLKLLLLFTIRCKVL